MSDSIFAREYNETGIENIAERIVPFDTSVISLIRIEKKTYYVYIHVICAVCVT